MEQNDVQEKKQSKPNYKIDLLFYLMQLVSTQTLSEGEAINKIIGEILKKAEKKNAEPIQFYWKNRITADGQLSTPSYNEISSPLQQELLDLQPESLPKKKPEKTDATFATMMLKDIIPEDRIIKPQPIKQESKDSEDRATNDAFITKSLNENHIPKPRAHYKNKLNLNNVSPSGTEKAATTFSTTDKQFKEASVTTAVQIATATQATKPKDNLNSLRTSSAEAAEDIFENEFRYNNDDNDMKTQNDKIIKIHQKNKKYYDNDGRYAHKNNIQRVHQKHTTKSTISTRLTATTRLAELNNIENAVNSVPNYEGSTTESVDEFLKRISKERDKNVFDGTNETDLKYDIGPVDKKNADVFTSSYVTTPSSDLYVTSPSSDLDVTNPSSDLYLLVDHKDNGLKAFFTLSSYNTEPVVTENLKPGKKQEINDLYKSILELYGDTKGFQVQRFKEEDTNKPVKFHEKIKKHMNWEAIKKFFGHNKVCGCKCKANKPMCRVCAESDAVIRELTFDFNNLADYMAEHCTEIQTYFWRNPNGGKKLRDSVHKIDTAMQNYFKRVKGKCDGRNCKTFTSYMDKRQNVKQMKVDKERLRELMRELGISDLK